MSDTSSTPSAPAASPKEPPFEVSVEPMKSGGSNFRAARLHVVSADQIMVKPTMQLKLFFGIFFVMPPIFIGVGVSQISSNVLFGTIFTVVGVAVLIALLYGRKQLFRTVVFDRRAGVCYAVTPGRGPTRRRLPLDKVAGLQIISEWNSSSDGPGYYSYEVNLVLDDPPGERFHVMDTGHRQACLDDARKLAELLDRPLWDQTARS